MELKQPRSVAEEYSSMLDTPASMARKEAAEAHSHARRLAVEANKAFSRALSVGNAVSLQAIAEAKKLVAISRMLVSKVKLLRIQSLDSARLSMELARV